jgi:hypothetical protein
MFGDPGNLLTGNHAIDMSPETPNESPRQLLQAKLGLIEAFNFSQLKQWVEARLRGKDVVLADMVGNSRAYPLVAIYPKLKRTVREDLQKACLELLNEFVSGRGLADEAADDLLILSQALFPEKAGDRLRLLVETPELFDKLPAELRGRVLQALVVLGEKMDSEFWTGCFRKEGKGIVAICFEGIAMSSVGDALEFLTRLGSDEHVLDSVILHIPFFLERVMKSGQEKAFASALFARRNRIPARLRQEIAELSAEMCLPQKPELRRRWLGADFDPQILLISDVDGNGRRRARELVLTAAL